MELKEWIKYVEKERRAAAAAVAVATVSVLKARVLEVGEPVATRDQERET